jgi:GT2 family glycosyltransferase
MTSGKSSAAPSLSIVVASNNARASIVRCLASLAEQGASCDIESVVVDNSTDGTCEIIVQRFPGMRLISASPALFIPELWELGIRQTTGGIVALLTAHCIPDGHWIEAILKAHQEPYAGIGGAIENDPAGNLVDWAIYFLRYTPFMLPFEAGHAKDIAGDNASYKRAALDLCQHVRRNGFWEPAIHAELRRAGQQVFLTPDIVVCHLKSFDFPGFMRNRFWHGREFGSRRAQGFTIPRRVLFALLSPLIPFLYLARITRQLMKKRRHAGRFLLSLPLLLLFLLAWTAGEFSGYIRPAKGNQA